MIILGLHNDEDSGVCLLEDGVILDAVSEERLNRIKLFKGIPEQSLQYVLRRHNLSLDQVDCFAYGWHGLKHDCRKYACKLANRIIKALENDPSCSGIIEARLAVEQKRDGETLRLFQNWMTQLGVQDEKIIYLDHHKSHAWSAFATSPFDEAVVITFDGRGDLKSATVSLADREEGLQELDCLLTFDSIGYLYGKITKYLGYRPHRHEGKVTGLAAYGNPEKTLPLFRKLIQWKNDTIFANLGFYKPFYSLQPKLREELENFTKEDIAAGVQGLCEELITKYVSSWLKKINRPNIKNICLAGGLFANVKINQRVAEIDGVENIFVFPHMGDGGLPVGSACYCNFKLYKSSKVELPTVYLGPEYSNEAVEKCLPYFANSIEYQKVENKVDAVVSDLIENKVVGYFAIKMEYGPRALGARSILYNARSRDINDWLNKRLKRTEFMPFAPVTPEEYAAECYINWKKDHKSAHFMTRTYDCTESFIRRHQGVVHIDGTARPQIVTQQLNGDYYAIVKKFCDETGDRALVNTSFNQHEEPIVCSPEDAIQSLLNDNIDVLYLCSYKIIPR